MNYNLLYTSNFEKEVKKLSKKYKSLKSDLEALFDELEAEGTVGTSIGNNCYKIRVAITSKGKGKSGGARLITHVFIVKKEIYLLSIYDKSEKENISEKELNKLLESIQK
jgi:mRNA-degrading endonuclease RelE of RelBE toxin-antitoxin system